MKTDHTISRREQREQQQHEALVFSVLNRTTAAVTGILGVYLMWSLLLGLTA
jgi:hypothetical protein